MLCAVQWQCGGLHGVDCYCGLVSETEKIISAKEEAEGARPNTIFSGHCLQMIAHSCHRLILTFSVFRTHVLRVGYPVCSSTIEQNIILYLFLHVCTRVHGTGYRFKCVEGIFFLPIFC